MTTSPGRRRRAPALPAVLRCDRIMAPCVIDGPVGGAGFPADTEQFLAPTLRRGAAAIINSPGSDKGQAVRRVAVRPA